MDRNRNIIILTNIMTPYRKFFYDRLYEEFNKENYILTVVLMANTEDSRHWDYNDLKTNYTYKLEGKTKKICNIEIHINKSLKPLYNELKPACVICGGSYLFPAVWETIKLQKKYGYVLFEWSESHLNEKRDYNRFKLRVRDIMRKKIIGKFNYFWNPGKFAMEFVKKYSPLSKCLYVPNLIDNTKFNIANKVKEDRYDKYCLSHTKKNYITPARLIPVKGILEFLSLYKNCDTENSRYIIVGDGELKEKIEEYITQNNLDVFLIGYRDENEMSELYSLCDGFILPSLSDANPLTCVEALWNGLPLLVSTHVGNYPEVIKSNQNGYVFSYENSKEAIKIIDEYLKKDEEWHENAKKVSLDIAKKMYNPDIIIPKVVKETIQIINDTN